MDTCDEKLVIMLVLCQKLYICTYNRQNFFPVTGPLRSPTTTQMVVLEPLLEL